jgi:acyl transferase domain-containing protein
MNNEFDIAIVGMSGRFPGARNVDEFWNNLAEGVESIARFSDQELIESGVSDACLSNPSYVKASPILDEPGHFDAGFFGFSPLEAKTMDPQHRILLELAYEALEDAGYDPDRYQGRIGVFTGSALNTYFTNVGLNTRLAEEYIPTLIGNDKDFLSTRISYKLNLKGPSITIQTACSTSMVALHLARQSLLSEETDMALAGAISVRVPHRAGYFFDGGGVVSPDGHVRAFDAKANGTVFGSGGGILVLKRLADALANGDTIHAVIKGSAVNNDGSEKAGYTAPSVNSQADAVVEALANAGVSADSITYIEAHGSGTPVGDPIEISALTKAFRTFTQRSAYCAIGSAKTNVGHLDAAAAVTGIIKTVLALKRRQLPPSLNFGDPNPEIDFPRTPFYVNTQLREWITDGPRRAGVMSTGMGGTNAHVVLEEAPQLLNGSSSVFKATRSDQDTLERELQPSAEARPQLLILSAKTELALDQATRRLREHLNRNASANMSDVAYTLQVGRKSFPHRRCMVCADREDAITVLGQERSKRILSSRTDESTRRPVVFLLPGIGDHYVGMAHDLYETWAVFQQEVDRCSQILRPHLGIDIRNIIYPSSRSWKKEGKPKGIDLKQMLARKTAAPPDPDAAKLNQTLFAQPALFTIEYATTRLWQSLGITPDAIVGHSMGEYVAACLAGVLPLEDALRLVAVRARLVNELPQGAMLAVTLAENELLPLLPDELSISLINGPRLCVVAGPIAAVAEFERVLTEKSIICRHVQNAHAFHSRMLDPILKAFQAEVNKVQLKEPAIPYISNVSGKWITRREAADPTYWAMHANHTARFSDALHELWQFEKPILLEAGPGRTLGVLAMQHPDRGGEAAALSSIRHDYENLSDGEYLWHALGRLWLSGAEIKWENAYSGQERRRISLPTYPFERQEYWLQPTRLPDSVPQAPGSIQKNPNQDEWLYVPSWKRLLPMASGSVETALQTESTKRWLIFADDSDLGSVLIARLMSAGHDVVTVKAGSGFHQLDARAFTIEPGNSQDYDSLIRALQLNQSLPDRIVHAWNFTKPSAAQSDCDTFTQAQAQGFYSLLFLAKALAAHNVGHEIKLFVLSNHVHEVCGSEVLRPEKSMLLGPCTVIPQEYPNIRVKAIDVEVPERVGAHEASADFVLGELLESDTRMFVAYRNAQRWVQTYEPLAKANHGRGHGSFREGGVYLITGGMGRIGVAISEYLAEKYGANLVLVGRSNLPNRTSWESCIAGRPLEDPVCAKIRIIERIEKLGGHVLYANANVSDVNAMRGAIEQAYQHFGNLHGVIHGAGIVGDDGYREIKDTEYDDCDAHFQAKAGGLLVLDEVLHGKSLDFCLLLSSLTSVLGGIGQAAYAASNIYMDSFARRHNRTSPVPWLSVNWDVWRLHDQAAIVSGPGGTLKELGMSAAEATEMLETALTMRTASQLVVSTGDLGARIDQWIKLESLDTPRPGTVSSASRSALSQRPDLQTSYDVPRDETEQRIARVWEEALGIDEVGINDKFSELGGHSLIAIRIVSELRKAFQIDLPVRALFDAPTVSELSSRIKSLLIAEIDALTEEEARQLVVSE